VKDELPRVATITTNIVDLREHCQSRIQTGDLDFDDWVYRTRDAIDRFVAEMTGIGYAFKPTGLKPRRVWLPRRLPSHSGRTDG